MIVCDCNTGFDNTGGPICDQSFSVTSILVAVRLVADDGTLNKILLADTLNASYFSDRVNDEDASKRWFPIRGFKNVASVREDTVVQTFDDGSSKVIRQGIKPWTGLLPTDTPVFLENILTFQCGEFGLFLIDIVANIRGELSLDALSLLPVAVDNDSWDPKYLEAADGSVEGIMLNFQYAQTVKDERLRMILASEITDFNLLDLKGLQDIDVTISTPATATTIGVDLKTEVYGARVPIIIKGLASTDFKLTNLDTASSVAISAAVEAPDGTYAIVFASTPASNMRLEDAVALTGFDFSLDFVTP